jgi:hypothetical protein
MLIGSYSITHLIDMYNDPKQRCHLEKHRNLLIFGAIIWILALVLLIIYWKYLETWARVIGVIGLLFNYGGSLFTLFVIFFGMKPSISPDPVQEVAIQPTNDANELININPTMGRMDSPAFTTIPVNNTSTRSYSADSNESAPSMFNMSNREPSEDVSSSTVPEINF